MQAQLGVSAVVWLCLLRSAAASTEDTLEHGGRRGGSSFATTGAFELSAGGGRGGRGGQGGHGRGNRAGQPKPQCTLVSHSMYSVLPSVACLPSVTPACAMEGNDEQELGEVEQIQEANLDTGMLGEGVGAAGRRGGVSTTARYVLKARRGRQARGNRAGQPNPLCTLVQAIHS